MYGMTLSLVTITAYQLEIHPMLFLQGILAFPMF